MRRSVRGAVFGTVMAAVVVVATACPPSQTPSVQTIPPGGRVVATGPIFTEMWIEDASDDLSSILYTRVPFTAEPKPTHRFFVYDDTDGTTTEVPVGQGEFGSASLAPDARSVVFATNDPGMQEGPTSRNCRVRGAPFQPDIDVYCYELYLFDLDTGLTRQLTGLGGSSERSHAGPRFSEDGTAIDFAVFSGLPPAVSVESLRLDLATGQIEDAPPPPPCCEWDRGTHQVSWDSSTGTLTSQDTTTGAVTTLWEHDDLYHLTADKDDGRLIVLSRWVSDTKEVFRLVDTDTGTVREVTSPWISDDGSHYAVVQANVSPDGTDRLIIAPLLP